MSNNPFEKSSVPDWIARRLEDAKKYVEEATRDIRSTADDPAMARFKKMLDVIGAYDTTQSRYNVVRDLCFEVKNLPPQLDEEIRASYLGMPPEIRQRLIALLEGEKSRLEKILEEEELAEQDEERRKANWERTRVRKLREAKILIEHPLWDYHPFVEMDGKKWYWNFEGFKPGDVIRSPDGKKPGMWMVMGSISSVDQEMGLTFVPKAIGERFVKEIWPIEDLETRFEAETVLEEQLGHYPKIVVPVLDLHALRERVANQQ